MAEGERQGAGRRHRRARRPGAPGTDPTPQENLRTTPERAANDVDRSWGDRGEGGNDRRLRENVPPHWGRR